MDPVLTLLISSGWQIAVTIVAIRWVCLQRRVIRAALGIWPCLPLAMAQ
jgi:hypothetical protein